MVFVRRGCQRNNGYMAELLMAGNPAKPRRVIGVFRPANPPGMEPMHVGAMPIESLASARADQLPDTGKKHG